MPSDKRRLTKGCQVRFGPSQYNAIRRAAEMEGLSISAFVRQASVAAAIYVFVQAHGGPATILAQLRDTVRADEHGALEAIAEDEDDH